MNTLDWGVRKLPGQDAKSLVTIPIIAWSTPWSIFGGNLQLIGATPAIHADGPGAADNYGFYNPILAARIAWDLGGGFGLQLPVGQLLQRRRARHPRPRQHLASGLRDLVHRRRLEPDREPALGHHLGHVEVRRQQDR
ncbi:hypothetical protein [Chenggangzhangella methanolivorans]|uniref:hypothetical protein n=1 Tax=Chenggangzhangella methanolivorans TaxID=1437009 RepID=UPI003204E9E6